MFRVPSPPALAASDFEANLVCGLGNARAFQSHAAPGRPATHCQPFVAAVAARAPLAGTAIVEKGLAQQLALL
eukprot:14682492-Alexandrium_andersonii.AAC.1